MLIGFDASRAFVPEATGTENYSLNLLRALAKVDRKNKYRVYVRSSGSQAFRLSGRRKPRSTRKPDNPMSWLPSNFEIVKIRPSHLWTQLGLALETWKNPVDLLFVPAHTLPILRRRTWAVGSGKVDNQVGSTKILTSYLKNLASHFPLLTSTRTKYVVTIHDLGVEYLPNYHKFPARYYLDFASRYAARHADAIIAVSVATKGDLIKRYQTDANKIFVVHEGIDTRFFKPQSKVILRQAQDDTERSRSIKVESVKKRYKISDRYILFVGTVQPRKNLRMLIQAFRKVIRQSGYQVTGKPDNPNTRVPDNLQLVIAGKLGWDYEEILAAPKKFGVEDRVRFLGHVADMDLPALYSGAMVFAFPSLFEGFGLPILEAISCGCPVVASDIPPHREILAKLLRGKDKEAGIVRRLSQGVNQEETNNLTSKLNWHPNLNPIPDISTPITLVKPKTVGKWASVLYQYISHNVNIPTNVVGRKVLAEKFSWRETAAATKEVFDAILR